MKLFAWKGAVLIFTCFYLPFQLESKKVDLNEYQGDEDFIVKKKCLEAAKLVNGPVMVEDTSLGFDAFGGLPGPYVKYFLDSIGPEGLHKMLMGWENKNASAACRIGFCESPSSVPIIFKGIVKGSIVEPRGSTGFGFDYCFQPEGLSLTFAQMEMESKNKLSHRYLAVQAMKVFFQKEKDQ